ncbi:hypothetical protein SprV_0401442600 [Sparganum proliferum]
MKTSNRLPIILIFACIVVADTGSRPFESTVDPGFKVTEAQIGDYEFPQCVIPLTAQCYTDNASSKVNFTLADSREITALEFLGSGGVSKKFSVLQTGPVKDGHIVVSGPTIAHQNFPLPFVPTEMVPVKNGVYGTPINVTVVGVCDAATRRDCLRVVEEISHIKVMAAIARDPVAITFFGTGKSWKVNFLPGSANICITQTLALLVSNLILQVFFN